MEATIEKSIIKWEFNLGYGNKTEPRQSIDVAKFWKAIEPHLPGTWKVLKSLVDDCSVTKHVHVLTVANEDDVRLYISGHGRKHYGHEDQVTIGISHYEHEAGPYKGRRLDTHYWFEGRIDPRATIDPTKRNAKAFAGDIVRKVIKPFEEIGLPKLREQRANDAGREADQNAAFSALEAAGVKLTERRHGDRGERYGQLDAGKVRFTLVASSTGIQLERDLNVQPKHAQALVDFLKLIAE